MKDGPSHEEPRQTKASVNEEIDGVVEGFRKCWPDVLPAAEAVGAAAGGAGVGAAGSFAALYFAGINGLSAVGITSGLATVGAIVGGGMVAGIGILAVPVAAGSLGAYWVVDRRRRAKLQMELNTAIEKLKTIQEQLVDNAEYYREELGKLKAHIKDFEDTLLRTKGPNPKKS